MRRIIVAALLASVAAAPAGAQAPAAPAERPWTENVRCLAMLERMPEMMSVVAQRLGELEGSSPEMRAKRAAAAKTLEDSRTVVRDTVEGVNRELRQEARRAVKGGDQVADQTFERELKNARVESRQFSFSGAAPEAQEAQLRSYEAGLQQACGADAGKMSLSR